MNYLRRNLFQLILLTGLLVTLSLATPVKAQDSTTISIIPPKFELFANPGDIITETIRIRNDSETPQTYGVLVEDFSSSGEEGKVVLEEGQEDTVYSLRKWIELSSTNLLIQPGEETIFPFTISVPKSAEPGGHYASILFQIGGADVNPDQTVTSVQHRVGSLVLLRVSGNVVEQASIESFQAPAYSRQGPVDLSLRIKNEGTTHVRPSGTIIITNMFGKKVDEIPLNGLNVFPGAIRKMDTTWDKGTLLGQYTATLVATYGQQNLPLTAATKFVVISPIAGILMVVGVIAALLFTISALQGRNRLLKALKVIISGE